MLGDDGGIYKRTNVLSPTGSWISLNSNLRVAECHSGDYDFASGYGICGAQDNGVSAGGAGTMWESIACCDGGVVATSQQTTPHQFYRTIQYMGFSSGCSGTFKLATVDTFPLGYTVSLLLSVSSSSSSSSSMMSRLDC